jgi:two-component sensor histidine kinase
VSGTIDEKALFPQHIFSPRSLNDSVITGGTLDKGFFFFNQPANTARFVSTADGLSSDMVFGGIPDSCGNIWILASNGIERYQLKTGKIFHYNLNDGIRDHVFSRAFCRLKNGIFVVGANSGIIYFNPAAVKLKTPPPDPVLTDFIADQVSYPVDSLLERNLIELSYQQNTIAFEFASVSFTGRNTDQYFYQLHGIDHNWIPAGARRSVTYANLAPARYTFTIKARNADGVESLHIASFDFTIYPPWWRSWWAIVLWFCLAVVFIYAIFDYRRRSRLALSGMRQKIAADLHDDIGSTLNSISVYSEIAGRQMETDPGNARSLLRKMGSASRNMIDTMNDIVWAVSPENDHFANVLQRMQYFAGELLSGRDIRFRFSVAENVKNIKLPMGKRKNFYLIFKEAINNSYKHANSTEVAVSIGLVPGTIVMTITDNGSGFETTDNSPGGNGLKNMRSRAREINGKLEISSSAVKGTFIELRLPV